MDTKPYYVTFAGPFGCSKSPVAQYIACELGVPMLANDVVRSEIKEDTLSSQPNRPELDRRLDARLKRLMSCGQSFVHDASQDRAWDHLVQARLEDAGYRVGIISFDLSPAFYRRLIKAKDYDLSAASMSRYLADHEHFLAQHSNAVIYRVTDVAFADRLELSLGAVRKFIGDKHPKKR